MKGECEYAQEKRNPWINCRFYIDNFDWGFMAYLDTYPIFKKQLKKIELKQGLFLFNKY